MKISSKKIRQKNKNAKKNPEMVNEENHSPYDVSGEKNYVFENTGREKT